MSELYAITVRLPWAAAIRDGEKLVENRGRPVAEKYIGQRVAIHAGAGWDEKGATDARTRRWWFGHEAQRSLVATDFTRLFRKVFAVATLADCHRSVWSSDPRVNCCSPWGDGTYGRDIAWHIVLADLVQLEGPFETRGYLPVPWLMPQDVADKVLAQVAGVSGV